MANPRQRRKARSSSHKAVSHSRHAKRNLKKTPPIRGPKVLQDAWDNHKTVRQNYAALGLIHDLNPSASGGVEIIEKNDSAMDVTSESQNAIPGPSSAPIPKGHGRIIRDEAGNVLRIELADSEAEPQHRKEAKDMDMEELAPEVDGLVWDKWVTELGGGEKGNGVGGKGNVVSALERISSMNPNSTTLSAAISGVGPRHASTGELAYLDRLVQKYGNDIERMARDRKLNPEQRTAGELRRGLKRAGIFESTS